MAPRLISSVLLLVAVAAITDMGQFPSLQIDPITGSIVVAYGSASGLKMSVCEPEECTTPRTTQPGCTPPLASASLTMINGAPFVAYAVLQKSGAALLLGLSCADLSCSSHTITKIGSSSTDLGYAVAAVPGPNATPVVTYIDRSFNNIGVATCLDRSCKTSTIDYLQTLSGAFYHTYGSTDIRFVDDRNHTVVVAFQQWSPNGTEGALNLGVCRSGSCSDGRVYIIDPNAAEYTSLTLDESGSEAHVLVAYTNEVYKQLRVADCRLPLSWEDTTPCLIRAVVTTTQMITSPVIRSGRTGAGVVLAYFQSWSGGRGGALYLLRCRTERCGDENPTDAVVVDSSPLWITSQMQIAMQLRPSDGRPVLAYSVYEAPQSFHLKVAICLTESCQRNRIYNIDDFRSMAQITLKFDTLVFVKGEIALVAITVVTVAAALYVPNKARIVNVYMIGPFTRDVLVNTSCRNGIGLLLLSTTCGALLSSIPWLLYAGRGVMSSIWHMFALSYIPVAISAFAYMAVLRCSLRKLFASGVMLTGSLIVLLNVLLTYTIGSYAFDCETISVPVPRDLSIVGFVVMGVSHLVNLFLCLRIYLALSMASPALLPSRWDEDL